MPKMPQVLSFRGTVIQRVWLEVLVMVAYTCLVVSLFEYYNLYQRDEEFVPKDLHIFQVLAVVTGMLLVFRTNTAYDRYYEGRKLWSEMVHNIRIISRTIWVMVDDKKDTQVLIGKISLLNLLVAFPYASKHYLREEYSRDEPDLAGFINHLPPIIMPSSNEPLEEQEKFETAPTEVALKHIRSKMPRKRMAESIASEKRHQREFGSLPYVVHVPVASNIPLEISCYITSYIVRCKAKNLIDSPTCRVLDTAVSNMVRCLTGFERIRRTPIPFAYSVHLQQITWIVLLMLPFQWVTELRWYTVPATFLASYALFGILGIGREIENPFGYDYNDLNLDDFCSTIHKEIMGMIAQPMPQPETWMFSKENHPIFTDPGLSAEELSTMRYNEIQMILSAGKDYKFFHKSMTGVNVSKSDYSVTTGGKDHRLYQQQSAILSERIGGAQASSIKTNSSLLPEQMKCCTP